MRIRPPQPLLPSRQAVRHRTLIPVCVGSNPTRAAKSRRSYEALLVGVVGSAQWNGSKNYHSFKKERNSPMDYYLGRKETLGINTNYEKRSNFVGV